MLKDDFVTSDMYLAATLTIWFPLLDIDRTEDRRLRFVFARSEGLDNIVKDYWDERIQVVPQTYAAKVKEIRQRMFNQTNLERD